MKANKLLAPSLAAYLLKKLNQTRQFEYEKTL